MFVGVLYNLTRSNCRTGAPYDVKSVGGKGRGEGGGKGGEGVYNLSFFILCIAYPLQSWCLGGGEGEKKKGRRGEIEVNFIFTQLDAAMEWMC